MPLNPKQRRFVDEYLIDLNATKAATRAGYSERTAYSIAGRLMKIPEIVAAIDVAKQERSERTKITQDQVLTELALIGFVNAGDYFDWGPDGVTLKDKASLTPAQHAAVAEVSETKTQYGGTIRLKLHDKRAALVDIGKHLGMFVERIGDPDGQPLKFTLTFDNGRDDSDD